MILATYNMFGGMKGNSLVSNIAAHYYFYIKNSFKQVIKRVTNLEEVKLLIKESNADILCVNEVIYELQKDEVSNFLLSLGYKTIIINKSSDRKNYFNLCTILASKHDGNELEIDIKKENALLKEGSLCAIEITSKNIIAIGVHLALSKKYRLAQLKQIANFIGPYKISGKNIFIMGDFNETNYKLQKYAEFRKMNLTSCKVPTYPSIPLFEWMKRDYDHIFHTQHHKINRVETRKGSSDHFLLKFDIIPIDQESIEKLN
ncbi:MAG: endonuclease/exonuclease/phosphatase family protein [Nanoarchaeota archaeon]